ncbi:MAG: ABC transporter permease [Pseudonocardia sp.]
MNLLEALRIALRALRANRLRSVLTTTGIIIGVSAVIVLVALGNGIQAGFTEQFSALTNQIQIVPVEDDRSAQPLTDADVEALGKRTLAPDITSVTPVVSGSALLQQQGQPGYRTGITGTTANYADVTDLELVTGTFFDEQQERTKAKVVILGTGPVTEMFGGDAGAAIGERIRIGRTTFRVIGVAKPTQQDDVAYLPLEAARSYVLGGTDSVNSIIVTAASGATVPAALEQVNAILDDRHRITDTTERDFDARAQQDFIDQASQFLTFLTLFTTAIAGISLVVGGIGVANIMLVSVTERTREIGIRKAIGATRRAILQQFLLESTVLAGLGGTLGVLVGLGLSFIGGLVLPRAVPDFPAPSVSPGSVVLALSISLLIGLVAGGYPANRAARLRPIEALRYQ